MDRVHNIASTISDAVSIQDTEPNNDEKVVVKEVNTEDEKPCDREIASNKQFSNHGRDFKEILKTNWKYLVVVVVLLPTLALLAACALLQGITIIMPIFIYPSFLISGCSFLIGTKRYGYHTAIITTQAVVPDTVDSSHANIEQQLPDSTSMTDSNQVNEEEPLIDNDKESEIKNSVDKIASLPETFRAVPPPPPPPPPPSPSPCNSHMSQVHCRKLLWDVVGRDSFKEGTVWNKMPKILSAEEIVDIHELSSLFGANKGLTPKPFKALTTKKRIMDTKKNLNIAISLAHTKLSVENVKEALLKGTTILPTDLLENLLKFAPNELEERALQKQGAVNLCLLDDAETFFYKIISAIPTYKERIRTMLLKAQLQERMNHIKPYLQIVITANKEVTQSISLKQFLQYVLTVGNFMNRTTTRGFKISFLSKLIFIKSNVDKKTTFLDFIVKSMMSSHPNMATMTKELTHVNTAAKIQSKFLEREMDELGQEIKHLENDVEKINNAVGMDRCFKQNIQIFAQQVREEFQSLVLLNNTATKSVQETLEYFGEEQGTTMTHEQLLGIIGTFLWHFQESVKKHQ